MDDEIDKAMAELTRAAQHAIGVLERSARVFREGNKHSEVARVMDDAAARMRRPIDRVRALVGAGPMPTLEDLGESP